MPNYCLNRQAQNTDAKEHEVHRLDSLFMCLPNPENRIDLGFHFDCKSAIAKAKALYPYWVIDGCGLCSPECHKM